MANGEGVRNGMGKALIASEPRLRSNFMRLMKKKSLILFSLLAFCSIAFAGYDVNDVLIEGDSTLMGMKIESSHIENGAFLIETTGARYEYVKGELKLYQGLEKNTRRLLSTITFDNEPNFVKVESNDDHIIFWSKDLNIGIYGDSTLIISPKVEQALKCRGDFKPDYEGRYKGELLLIDNKGGMEIYPQRYEAGYKIKNIELGRQNWIADYELNAGERVMLAAFPGRPFDWDKSFKSNIVVTGGSMGLGINNPYGQMASDWTLKHWANNFHIITVFFNGFYKPTYINGIQDSAGPYIVANEPEFRRFLKAAHRAGMKVAVYCSLLTYTHRNKGTAGFYEQINELKNKFDVDGLYIDGLTFDVRNSRIDNKIGNWEMIRRFRRLFGTEGVIVYHGTSLGSPVATVPNIDSYCDATLNGEGVAFRSVNDSYVQYQVKKYGISNTVAFWKQGPHPDFITKKNITEAIIRMNGRMRLHRSAKSPSKNPYGRYIWPVTVGAGYSYYLGLLERQKRIYLNKR
jgi:hypothetical protein